MKTISILLPVLILCVLLCSCARIGEKDSLDFLKAMENSGYELAPEEVSSSEEMKESCFVGSCKLTMLSTSSGKLKRVSITYAGRGDFEEFRPLACSSIEAMCGYTAAQTQDVLKTLGIDAALPESTSGVFRCATQWYFFSFRF